MNTKKSVYDYPEPIKVDDNKDKKELEKVALSTTNKAKARAVAKATKMEEEAAIKEKAEEREKAVQREPATYVQSNPGRVLHRQQKHVEFIQGHRYTPVIQRKTGIVFLVDTQPPAASVPDANFLGEKKVVEPAAAIVPEEQHPVEIEMADVPPPEDFVYDEDA